jgi:MFS superfamily sulfate permease-like transporter
MLMPCHSCIGGVGIFLIETGLEVSRGLKEEGFDYTLSTLKLFFDSPHSIILWTLPLALAILLRIITHFFHHSLIFPAYFFVIPIVFYIVVAIGGWDYDYLRAEGWVFDVGKNTQAWWKFYTYFVSFPHYLNEPLSEKLMKDRISARPTGPLFGRPCLHSWLWSSSVSCMFP